MITAATAAVISACPAVSPGLAPAGQQPDSRLPGCRPGSAPPLGGQQARRVGVGEHDDVRMPLYGGPARR